MRESGSAFTSLLAQPEVGKFLTDLRIIDPDTNEFFLWHGTKPALAKTLAQEGFDERVANLGGLYGAGSYFADAACKSNQYADETNAQGERCMLYCRVTMGEAFKTDTLHTNARRAPDNPSTPGRPYDSIFAEKDVGNSGTQSHNEYVVFRSQQCYPEYIIWYK
jgi:hypothetical protein